MKRPIAALFAHCPRRRASCRRPRSPPKKQPAVAPGSSCCCSRSTFAIFVFLVARFGGSDGAQALRRSLDGNSWHTFARGRRLPGSAGPGQPGRRDAGRTRSRKGPAARRTRPGDRVSGAHDRRGGASPLPRVSGATPKLTAAAMADCGRCGGCGISSRPRPRESRVSSISRDFRDADQKRLLDRLPRQAQARGPAVTEAPGCEGFARSQALRPRADRACDRPQAARSVGLGAGTARGCRERAGARRRLATPDLSEENRVEAMGKIAELLGLSFPLRSFAVVIARHGRIGELTAVSEAYLAMVDEALGRARATLTFARQPSRSRGRRRGGWARRDRGQEDHPDRQGRRDAAWRSRGRSSRAGSTTEAWRPCFWRRNRDSAVEGRNHRLWL